MKTEADTDKMTDEDVLELKKLFASDGWALFERLFISPQRKDADDAINSQMSAAPEHQFALHRAIGARNAISYIIEAKGKCAAHVPGGDSDPAGDGEPPADPVPGDEGRM